MTCSPKRNARSAAPCARASAIRRTARTATTIDGQDLFELHDTFGMPIELSVEEAKRSGAALSPTWQQEYDALMNAQRERSHQARAAAS